MRTLRNYFLAAIAMVFLASVSAFAQQGARRNATVTSRQETKAERKQEKVNEVQKPASVSNQSATDQRMRSAGGTSSNRRDGAGVASGSSSNVSSNASSNSSSNDSRIAVGGNSGKSSGSSSADSRIGAGSGANKPSGGSVSGNSGKSGSGYGGSSSGNHSGNYGYGYGGGNKPSGGNSHSNVNVNINVGGYGTYPGGYNYPGMRPALPPSRVYDSYGIVTRTNASTIVIRTAFRSKAEAYDYVARLLDARYFTIGGYGNGYSWLQTDVTFIPTPFDWTNPMTHNQFRIRVDISSSLFGGVKVTLSGEWRESILSDAFSILRFQPSDRYSTYYAWSILEDIAENIPGTAIAYR